MVEPPAADTLDSSAPKASRAVSNGVPPNHPCIVEGFSVINHPAMVGVPPFLEISIGKCHGFIIFCIPPFYPF